MNLDPHKKEPFYKEVHKRDLFKVSVVYIVLGLIIWKLAIILTPLLSLPSNIPRVVALFLVVFFPIALVLAWIFEMAPEGFVKVGSKESIENPYTRALRKPFTSNVLIVALIIVMLLLYIFFPSTNDDYSMDSNSSKSIQSQH